MLSGRVKTSPWVTAVADWLKIGRPQMAVETAFQVKLLQLARELDDDAQELVLALLERLNKTRPPDPGSDDV